MTQTDIDFASDTLKVKIPEIMQTHVIKVIMYGSCARGDYDDNSDIDIAILTDCDRIESKKYDSVLMDTVTDIAMKSDAVVEYICIPFDEFEEKKVWYGYFKNIEKDGKLIYG